MKKKRIIMWLVIVLIIGVIVQFNKKTPQATTEKEKQDFIIQTFDIWGDENNATVTKNGKIEGISNITLTAQTAWRVSAIINKIGTAVSKWSRIIQLEDTQWSTTFRAESSAVAVQSAENNLEIQRKNLEKQVSDLQLARERAILNFTNTVSWERNNTLLQIEWLQKNLEKAKLDYNIKVNVDDITLQNNITSAKNVYNDTLNLLLDVLEQSDKLLGVSEANRRLASDYDIYLWWRNLAIREKAEWELRQLFAKREQLQVLWNSWITLDTINNYLDQYKSIALAINDFTVTMKDVFINSLVDARYLPEATLNWFIASFGVLQSKASGITTSITAQTNSLKLFVDSYKPNQESLKKQIEILENDIVVRQKQLEEAAKNSEINLKVSEWNYDFAATTKDLNIETIENALRSAQIALSEAQFNLAKLRVEAPIDWIISDILVDVWQEVAPGTPLVTFVSEWKGIKLFLSEKEVQGIQVWKEVIITNENYSWTWVVVSVWVVGDKNGNFPVEIYIESWEFVIWSYTDVSIPANRWSFMLPINAVSIIDNNIWQIVLWDWTSLSTQRVRLWIVLWQSIEVKDSIDQKYKVVISDIKNYDKEKMTIVVK